MKFLSWNVNGLRACLQKGFDDFLQRSGADFFSIQETKLQRGQTDYVPAGYHAYWNDALKKGYSGTAVFAKEAPLDVRCGLGGAPDDEGRVLTLEYPGFFLVNCYSPNSQEELRRLGYRLAFEDELRAHLTALAGQKPVICCGDLNVAHEEIDLKNPKPNMGSAGFSDEERAKMTELLAAGFVDSFRSLYPDRTGAYSWWSYRFSARAHNAGWRIDYFLVSENAREHIRAAEIFADVEGSDHCPVGLELDL